MAPQDRIIKLQVSDSNGAVFSGSSCEQLQCELRRFSGEEFFYTVTGETYYVFLAKETLFSIGNGDIITSLLVSNCISKKK